MRRPSLLFAAFAAIVVGGPVWAEPLPVVATLPVLADFVQVVGGDRVRVRSLITGLESEHTYTPKPSDVLAVHEAAMLVKVGLGLEVWVNGLINNADNPRLVVVDTSRGLALMRGEDSHVSAEDRREVHPGEEHRMGGNPHVWLDPENAQAMIRQISDGLIRADPKGRTTYLANQAKYLTRLDALQREITALFAGITNRKIITHHPAWPYFARRFDLQIRGDIFTQIGSEPSARRIADLIRRVKKDRIRVIVSEPQLSPKIPQALAQETGARVVVLTPLPGALPGTEDYLAMMRYNARTLAEALR
ncbi:MAG: metal ABC transporter substrate-binding protein [Nitrospiria bacterium]